MFLRFSVLFFILLLSIIANSQVLKPGKLTAGAPPKNAKVGDEIELVFNATIDKGWYMYSVGFDSLCGPILMSIKLEKNPGFQLVGELKAVNDVAKHDKIFDCDVRIFTNTGQFKQKIKILSPNINLTGSYEGQVCSEVRGLCVQIAGDLLFEKISVTGKATENFQPKKEQPKQQEDPKLVQPPVGDTVKSEQPVTPVKGGSGSNKGPILDKSILGDAGTTNQNESLWGYMIVAFLLGLTSLITPCVFPMIPMTVTFFLKDDQSRSKGIRMGFMFGLSIIVIYTIVGTAFALIFGAEGLNALATHWLPNLLIFVIFIIFALSFLGLFEITAPHKLVNSADRAAEKGGYAGIFFMSATLVLVSFSCTIPLVGNVLVLAAGGEIVKPIMGMFAYSLAFAVPFTLFAVFPEWLKSLPKSGGWLNSVKVTLGLVELALALKFFSIADQTYHWGLLDRDVNIAIWIVIFSFLGIYFLGKLRLPHDSPVDKVTVPRLMLSILTFSFVVYLIPGLWGAPLKLLAGYLPPMYTHDFDLISMARNDNANEICDDPKYADFLHLPHKLNGYFDYNQAIACARQQHKPLFIDFTGHGCTNCREMEAVVWSHPDVLKRLQDDFVVVALYVDDRTELPESEWYTSAYDKKVKKTIGKQNADLQISKLDNNAQPFYVLVGEDERVLAVPYGYDKSVEEFVRFLEKGKKKYAELYK
jgi:thiol:disulfide interchange protein DsbD